MEAGRSSIHRGLGDASSRRQDVNKDVKMVNWLCWQLRGENSKWRNRVEQRISKWSEFGVSSRNNKDINVVGAESSGQQVRDVIR